MAGRPLIGRDTEYYLKSRHEVPRRGFDPPRSGGRCFGQDLHDIDTGAGQEEKTRTDPDVMVSPPGGIVWGGTGAFDGVSDVGSSTQMPTLLVVP
jgi:hypothetical protein